MKVVSWDEGGYKITTVDYQVLRVSFLGMKQERFDLLIRLLAMSKVVEVRRAAASLAERARKRQCPGPAAAARGPWPTREFPHGLPLLRESEGKKLACCTVYMYSSVGLWSF